MKNMINYTRVGRIYRRDDGGMFDAICTSELRKFVDVPANQKAITVEYSDIASKDAFQFTSTGVLNDINEWGGPFLYYDFQKELKRQWRLGNNYLRILY